MNVTIKLNHNKKLVEEVRNAIKENGGYCPCAVFKNNDTKCMCKDFRDQILQGVSGKCHCGLYEGVITND